MSVEDVQVVKDIYGNPAPVQGWVPSSDAFVAWSPYSTGTATIANGASNSDLQTGYGLALQKVFIPAAFTGTALAIHITNASDGTPAALYTDATVAVSITVSATNKGKWVALDTFSTACQGMLYFRFTSNGTEAEARSIPYILG